MEKAMRYSISAAGSGYLPGGYELATDAHFRELSNFTTPVRAGRITAIEASGQVRVETDDAEGGDVLAWPLNGFTYAVGDVVFVDFAVNHPESAIVIGSKGATPVLDGVVRTTTDQSVAGVKNFTNGIKVGGGLTLTTLLSGTYTPAITGSAGNPTISGGSYGGHYLRIGNWVLLHLDVGIGTITAAGSGDVRISLPIAAANYNLLQAFWHNVDMPGTPVNVMAITIQGQNYLQIAVSQDNAASLNLQHSGLSSTDAINVTGIYQV
jgi:hypothetical protein